MSDMWSLLATRCPLNLSALQKGSIFLNLYFCPVKNYWVGQKFHNIVQKTRVNFLASPILQFDCFWEDQIPGKIKPFFLEFLSLFP